jgi:formylglycine-generating enzyme required for sulfatase activity
MDTTEVTLSAYEACVKAGACAPADAAPNCNWAKRRKGDHPVNCVDWNQATAHCGWAGKRLPTEEEWEYAARGTDGRKYAWGNDAPGLQLCWNRTEGTCVVGSYKAGASPFGVLDMAGNVWEWTSSGHSIDYSNSPATHARSTRGGSWVSDVAGVLRAADRRRVVPSYRTDVLGFRCAR